MDRVQLDPSKRVGLLTQASLLATMAKQDRTDPVRRGKFVLNQILCRIVNPPSPEIVAMFKPLDLSKTARDQFTEHRTNPVCASCHQFLDPLGLPFEHYDGMGMWRDTDRGMEIDASGDRSTDKHASTACPRWRSCCPTSPSARACYVAEWLRFSEGKLNSDADEDLRDWLMSRFSRNTQHRQPGDDHGRQRHVPVPRAGGRCAVMKPTKSTKAHARRGKQAPSTRSRARCRGGRCSRGRWASASRCRGWS